MNEKESILIRINADLVENKYKITQIGDQETYDKLKTIHDSRWDAKSKTLILPYTETTRQMIFCLFDNAQMVFDQWEEKNLFYLHQHFQQLHLKAYSEKTIVCYSNCIKRFEKHLAKDLETVSAGEIRQYHLDLLSEGNSHSYTNISISCVKFLYVNVIKKDIDILALSRPRKQKILPKVLSLEEVKKIISSLDNEKHKTILYVVYSAGLRVSEVASLRIEDIDSERMMIKVSQGKGRKDRYTMLSQNVLDQLRKYYVLYRPVKWLFEGADRACAINDRTIQRIFKRACVKAGIKKDVSVHALRHYVECF